LLRDIPIPIMATFQETTAGGDYWVTKLDANGGLTWKKCYGGSLLDIGTSIQQLSAGGGYIVAGYTSSTGGDVSGNHGSSDYWLVRTDANGVLLWQKTLGGSGGETTSGVRQTSDGGYVVTGSSNSTNGDVTGNHGVEDFWVVKLATDNATGISEINSDDVISVYPNPASDYVNIRIANAQAAKIAVLNILGEEMITQTVSPSSRNVSLAIDELPTGTYLIQLSTEKEITTSKFVKE